MDVVDRRTKMLVEINDNESLEVAAAPDDDDDVVVSGG